MSLSFAAIIGIGSNIAPEGNVALARDALGRIGPITAASRVYQTPAIDRPEQDDYWNQVVVLDCPVWLPELHIACRAIEADAGRVRTADKYAARTLDLDVLRFDDRWLPDVKREITERPFLQWCLFDIGLHDEPDSPPPTVVGG